MKDKYSWYFPLSESKIDEIWDEGAITFDANVLLDLYRYNENTRESLISSIERIKCAKWLTAQATEEFFRNRKKSILSSSKTFKEATDEIEKLKTRTTEAIQSLKGNRLIPSKISEKLLGEFEKIISTAAEEIEEEKRRHPNFLENDPILERLFRIFDNAVGDDFSDADRKLHSKTAEERKSKKLPPGYMDKDKDGERAHGDYFLWRQILDHAKKQNKSMILVTSEKKEDWWESISGQTVGPRYELMKEAHEETGQNILIYHTERFLSYALHRLGEKTNEKALAEINEVSELRYAGNAVKRLGQTCTLNTATRNFGELTIQLARPVKNFTGSGQFLPKMIRPPRLTTSLVKAPPNLPEYKLTGGTGTVFDFNLHIKAIENNDFLPEGLYVFHYEAEAEWSAAGSWDSTLRDKGRR